MDKQWDQFRSNEWMGSFLLNLEYFSKTCTYYKLDGKERGGIDLKKLVSLLSVCLLIISMASPTFAQGEDKNCSDFSTWREAQDFFNTNDPNNDPHGLDRDKDGIVCNTLPGFDMNYQAGTPLGQDNADDQGSTIGPEDNQGGSTTTPTDTTNDEGAGLANTATTYPIGGTIGLLAATKVHFILF